MRVLILEDNFILALDLSTEVQALGNEVVGPVATEQEAIELVRAGRVDAAILDFGLKHGDSTRAALALAERAVPFVFVTGHRRPPGLPQALADVPLLSKPLTTGTLTRALADLQEQLRQSSG